MQINLVVTKILLFSHYDSPHSEGSKINLVVSKSLCTFVVLNGKPTTMTKKLTPELIADEATKLGLTANIKPLVDCSTGKVIRTDL